MSKSNVNNNKPTNGGKKPYSKPKHSNKPKGYSSNRNGKQGVVREQPKADSNEPRVNYDNAREDKVAKQIEKDAKSGKFNDINDFLHNPTLIRAASSYNVFPILGQNIGRISSPAGIMVFEWYPNYGMYQRAETRFYDLEGGSATKLELTPPPVALNQAADSTYSFLVHANSRNYSYNSSDLFMLVLAGANVFAIIEAMKRGYGLAKYYVEQNQYVPNRLLESLGFDPQDLRNNLGKAWFDINNLIVQTRQIWVPSTFPLISRWMDLNSNLYKDATGEYAQLYTYVQKEYHIYDETALKTGGYLRAVTVREKGAGATATPFTPGKKTVVAGTSGGYSYNPYKWETWVEVAQSMIDALVNSEDRGIIYGDLLNAYGAQNIMAIPEIDSTYTVMPEYSPEISMQIENTVPYRGQVPHGLVQKGNRLFPLFTSVPTSNIPGYSMGTLNSLLNFHVDSDPTPDMVLLATRFMALGTFAATVPVINATGNDLQEQRLWVPLAVGSEVVTGIYIVTSVADGSSAGLYYWQPSGQGQNVTNGSTAEGFKESFDWAPFYHVIAADDGDASGNYAATPTAEECLQLYTPSCYVKRTFGDHDRYTEIDWVGVKKIHDACEFSLFGVPQM